jgi:hypothetical protein
MYVIALHYEGAVYFWRAEYMAPPGTPWIGLEGAAWGRFGPRTTIYRTREGAEAVFPQGGHLIVTLDEARAIENANAI